MTGSKSGAVSHSSRWRYSTGRTGRSVGVTHASNQTGSTQSALVPTGTAWTGYWTSS